MKEEAIKVISAETGDTFKEGDIQWVLTVPAIWTPKAKQFMREAAYEVRNSFRRTKVFIVSYDHDFSLGPNNNKTERKKILHQLHTRSKAITRTSILISYFRNTVEPR